jgi:hypothetical protein
MSTAAERRAARAAAAKAASNVEEPTVETKPEETPAVKSRSRDTVTVACKIPNGLILQNHTMEDGFEPVFGGGSRPIKVARPVGEQIRITGSARAYGSDPEAKRVIGGYGLTYNVPKDAFEKWMRDNSELDMVKNKLIFAHESVDHVTGQAQDLKTLRTGLEPLNTESRKSDGTYVDPRMPKNIKKFKPDDDSTDIRGVA